MKNLNETFNHSVTVEQNLLSLLLTGNQPQFALLIEQIKSSQLLKFTVDHKWIMSASFYREIESELDFRDEKEPLDISEFINTCKSTVDIDESLLETYRTV